jgi:uncharacterized protein YndB with AHSA1/START domain
MNATLHTAGGRTVLVMERHFAQPVAAVWDALTDPAQLARWFPANVEVDGGWRVGAPVRFPWRNGEMDEDLTGEVTEFEPPRVLAFTWGDDHLRFALHPDGDGCRMQFEHTFDNRPGAPDFAAGWHVCLDELDAHLRGDETHRPDGTPSPKWAELRDRYAEQLR